jgi:hypothetical protein
MTVSEAVAQNEPRLLAAHEHVSYIQPSMTTSGSFTHPVRCPAQRLGLHQAEMPPAGSNRVIHLTDSALVVQPVARDGAEFTG